MTEITFQFVPSSVVATKNRDIKVDDDWKASQVRKAGGLIAFRLGRQRTLEFSKLGSVRYSEEISDLEGSDLDRILESAKEFVQKILQIDISDYTVCLLISGCTPIQAYLSLEENIKSFAEERLDCGYPHYSELNDETVKLSFRQSAIV